MRVIRCRFIFSGKNDELTPDFFSSLSKRLSLSSAGTLIPKTTPDPLSGPAPSAPGTNYGTFSPWPLSLVDRADSLLLNVGE